MPVAKLLLIFGAIFSLNVLCVDFQLYFCVCFGAQLASITSSAHSKTLSGWWRDYTLPLCRVPSAAHEIRSAGHYPLLLLMILVVGV